MARSQTADLLSGGVTPEVVWLRARKWINLKLFSEGGKKFFIFSTLFRP